MVDVMGAAAALQRGDFAVALEHTDGDAAGDVAAALEIRAQAFYGDGQFERSIAAWEQLYEHHRQAGAGVAAARAAGMAALFLLIDTGLMASVRVWIRRAERAVGGNAPTSAHAVTSVVRAYERFMTGDLSGARDAATAAIDLGTQFGEGQMVLIARTCLARIRIFEGEIEAGLDDLDELAIDLMSDQSEPLTTGMMYCELICAAQGMALHDRATEWTSTMHQWRQGGAIGTIHGRCRVHRAEILRVTGPSDEAEAEALGACDDLRPWMRREFGWPLVELGTIRLRRGDLAGAEEAFLAADERAWSPHPGLALLRLEQGAPEVAATMIADAIANPFDIPWKLRPPMGRLRFAPLLDAQVEIAVARADADTARAAAAELEAIAEQYPSPWLAASSQLAVARLAYLDGRHDDAVRAAKLATAAWSEIGAPFESAMARVVLGLVRQAQGDHAGATLERQAALAGFERFGAERWVERMRGSIETEVGPTESRTEPPSGQAAQSGQLAASFVVRGDMREVSYRERSVALRDLVGYRYVERLLSEPGREFHVLDLVAVERGAWPTHFRSSADDGLAVARPGGEAGIEMIDDIARDAYRRRLAEVDEDIEEAREMGDLGRLELAEHDRAYLIAELSSAVGLGGRVRSAGGTEERARTSVTRSIRYALGKLAEHHGDLAAHLQSRVRTGAYCSYEADPLIPVEWSTGLATD